MRVRRAVGVCIRGLLVLGVPFDVEFSTRLGFEVERLGPRCRDQQLQSVSMQMQLPLRVAGDFKLDHRVLWHFKDHGAFG